MNTVFKSKKKIAVIGLKGLPAFGGAATVGENIIEQLKGKYDFTVYSTSSHTNLKTGMYNGYKQIVIRAIPFKRLNTLYYNIVSCFHVIFRLDYDLVHLHHTAISFMIPILKCKNTVIVTTHGVHLYGHKDKFKKFKWFFQSQIGLFLKKANIVTCVSKVEKEWLINKHNVEAIYIPNGINITNDINIKKKYDIIFGAGRIIKEKGLHTLLHSLERGNLNYNLAVAGDLEHTRDYKNQIYSLSEKLNVDFLGLIKNKNELFKIIKSSKLFVFPSLQEAMSMMLLEVASLKVPIICSDIKENKDVFNEKEVLFFKAGDDVQLLYKIKYAFNNYADMVDRANNAYEKVVKNHNWGTISLMYKEIYEALISK